MLISPRVLGRQIFDRTFRRNDESAQKSQQRLPSAVDPNVDVEELLLWVDDDVDIVIRNYNLGVSIKDLPPQEAMVLVNAAFHRTYPADDGIRLYGPG